MIRQAIITKYYGPTNHRGSRIKATAYGGSIWVSWDYELNVDANHIKAAVLLQDKMKWNDSPMIAGSMPNDTGYCFVFRE